MNSPHKKNNSCHADANDKNNENTQEQNNCHAEHGHTHENAHKHTGHGHCHGHNQNQFEKLHKHAQICHQKLSRKTREGDILTVRALSGLSGDIILCGLACMTKTTSAELHELIAALKIPALSKCVDILEKSVNEISGFHAKVTLAHEHAHRKLSDIIEIIDKSELTQNAKDLSKQTFTILGKAEAKVHGKEEADVTFHEVGALDSILDICIACALFDKLKPAHFVCSALPIADGSIFCAHGHIPSPAPAVLELLENVPVCAFAGTGETVTPTAIALLKALGASFDLWPSMTIERKCIAYGTKKFPDVANGSIWAWGKSHNI